VEHVNQGVLELDDFGGWERGAWAVSVDIAADSGDGSDGAESVEEVVVADISRVQDVVDARQCPRGFWSEKTVCIGDDADEH